MSPLAAGTEPTNEPLPAVIRFVTEADSVDIKPLSVAEAPPSQPAVLTQSVNEPLWLLIKPLAVMLDAPNCPVVNMLPDTSSLARGVFVPMSTLPLVLAFA